jgi:3-hydroxyacyl-CoA dehydrogenase
MKINVVGSGVMGIQIAALFYHLGCEVSLVSRKIISKKKILNRARVINKFVENESVKKFEPRICSHIEEIYDACTIETVTEDIDTKRSVYSSVRKVTDKAFISNTSSFIPGEIANDVIGLHFFNPIHLKFVELSCSIDNTEISKVIAKLISAGFDIIPVNKNRGYIANYLLFNEIGTVLKLIDVFGYSANTVQSIYQNLYPERDIFKILDIIGLDVAQSIFNNLNQSDPSIYIPKCIDIAVESGIFGRKNKTSILDVIDNNY